jgi:hypothetical protein
LDKPTGGFTFSLHVLGKVIVRINPADNPATTEQSAFRHEDLMVIYVNDAQDLRAVFFDSEGRVIQYSVQISSPGEVAFISFPTTAVPGFQLAFG